MAKPELEDQSARDRIEREALDRNMVVLAGAGAGKTHELVERMVNCVRIKGASVERMAAITFTRKAAGEMRGRFLLRLQERLAKAQGEEAARLQGALDRVDQCFIGTIHSFCGQLLRERPVEAGIRADFTEIDGREETRLSRRVWGDFVQQCFAAEDPRLEALEVMGIGLADLHEFFNARCGMADLPLKVRAVEPPDLTGAVRAARRFIADVAQHIPEPLLEGRDDFLEAFERARLFIANCDLSSERHRVTLLKLLHVLEKKSITLRRWAPNGAYAKVLRDELRAAFVDSVTRPALTQWRQYIYPHVVEFIDDAVAFYNQQRLSKGQMTFGDLLLRATALLRDSPQVRRYFGTRYEILFVDEFQDTDPIQAEMLFYLTGADTESTDWQRLEPRPGSLFIVGDEKQSIYRFRRADVATFRLAGARLEVAAGSTEQLNTSFRSLGNLCTWINGTFSPLFAAFESAYQARFAPMLQYKPAGQDCHCVRQIRTERVYRHSRAAIADLEGERIADFIAAALAGQTALNGVGEGAILDPRAEPGDFLILTQTRKMLPRYAAALEARGIPYDVSGGGQLGDRPEVRSFVELIEAVHRPDHPLPLLGYLRGQLVGLGDDELYRFKNLGGLFNYRHPEAIPEALPAETKECFEEAFDRLRRTEERMRRRSPAVAFEQTMEELALPAFSLCEEMGSSRAGTLLRLLALVRHWDSQGWHWGQVVEELREVIEDGDYKIEEMTLESGQDNVVKLMNIHQSKGLQAKVVFLADPMDETIHKEEVPFHVSRTAVTPFLSLPVRRSRGEYASEVLAEPYDWQADGEEELKFIRAEKLRLVYVAATRAENLLVVSRYTGKEDRGSWSSLYPRLDSVPELPETARTEKVEQPAPLPDWARIEKERAGAWTRVKTPSYRLRSVTAPLVADDQIADATPGRGRDYGTLVHRFFEMAINSTLPDEEAAYIRQEIAHAGLEASLMPTAQRALDGFRASEIWRESEAADRVYTEVPFAVGLPQGGVMRGVIDLVYAVKGGWKIVDYKTGIAGGEVGSATRDYAAQVRAYAEQWSEITGEAVMRKGIWMVDHCQWLEC